MKKLILVLGVVVLMTACVSNSKSVKNVENEKINSNDLSVDSGLDDFMGVPSVVMFGGTYCPHCVTSVPEFEEEVFAEYEGRVNMWVQVVDGQSGAKFEVNLPQGFNSNLNFELLSGEECGYVPSWVVLDKEGDAVLASCGSEHSFDEMKESLEGLL